MQLKKKNWFCFLFYRLKIILTYLKAYFFSASFLIFIKSFLNKYRYNDAKNILVVQTEKLGDIILSLTFLYNLSESEKDCEKFLLIDEKYSSGLFSEELPFKLMPINKRKYRLDFFYRTKLLNNLRELKLKHTINISPSRGILNDEITLNSNSRSISCLSSKAYYLPQYLLKKNNLKYNSILKSDSKNEYSLLQELLNTCYKQIFTSEFRVHDILLSSKPNITLNKKYVIIAPSASDADRNWSQNNFRELCEKLSKKYYIYLLGLQSQTEYLSVISDGLTNVRNLAGKLRLDECIHLIQNSLLFVGLDSGFTHIAYSFNKPFVAIIGGGKFGRFFPYPEKKNGKYKYYELPCFNCNWQCIYKEIYCVSLVTVEDVYNTCINLIDSE